MINRVEVPDKDEKTKKIYGAEDLETIYAIGKKNPQKHPGYDCFFWRRDATPAIRLYTRGVFVGYPPIGKHITAAMQCATTTYREIRGKRHTFHLGDRNGGWNKYPEYEHFNRKAAKRAPVDFGRLSLTCAKAKQALEGKGDAACAIDTELKARPFSRWDIPGTEWPPKEKKR